MASNEPKVMISHNRGNAEIVHENHDADGDILTEGQKKIENNKRGTHGSFDPPDKIDHSDSIKWDIMLSYNNEWRDKVLKIGNKLKEFGYKVWMDVDCMPGNIYKGMATGVNDSKIIIICMTEEYVASENCMREIQFAADKKKELIPIILQENFNPKLQGTLSIIIAGKLYFDFSDNTQFEGNITTLKKSIEEYLRKSGKEPYNSKPKPTLVTKISSAALTLLILGLAVFVMGILGTATDIYLSDGYKGSNLKAMTKYWKIEHHVDPFLIASEEISRKWSREYLLPLYEMIQKGAFDLWNNKIPAAKNVAHTVLLVITTNAAVLIAHIFDLLHYWYSATCVYFTHATNFIQSFLDGILFAIYDSVASVPSLNWWNANKEYLKE